MWGILSRTEVALRLFSASETLSLGVVLSVVGAHRSGSFRPGDSLIPLRALSTTKGLIGGTNLTPFRFQGDLSGE